MIWYFLLGALAVLVILPLFGFVGCSDSFSSGADISTSQPTYPAQIKSTGGLVAYWRLGDLSTPVPTSGGAAQDETVGFNGDYFKLVPAPQDVQRHSRAAKDIIIPDKPGLLINVSADPHQSESPCIFVDGGFMKIPANDPLNPSQFTVECWIDLTGFGQEPPGNYYCLVESTGPKGLGPRSTGFGLYLGPKDFPPKPTPGPYFWQVWMGDGTQFTQRAVANNPADFVDPSCYSPPPVPLTNLTKTYLALTFDGNNLQLFLYNSAKQELSLNCVRALHGTVTNFVPNVTAKGGGGDFFIGTGSNLFPSVAPSFVQVAAATPQTPTATVTVGYPGTQTAGNLNIVVVGWKDTTATVQSVSDTAGNPYTLAIGPTQGTGLQQSIYFAAKIKGGGNTVTVIFNPAAKFPDIRILEYAGVLGEGALDQAIGAKGNSATAQCGPVTTTAANELIFAANTAVSATTGPGTGFTTRIITPNKNLAEDRVVSTTGSVNATAPLKAPGQWVMQMVTFRAGPSQRLYPFKGKIQEVALYKTDLSAPNNQGVTTTLGIHVADSGNFPS